MKTFLPFTLVFLILPFTSHSQSLLQTFSESNNRYIETKFGCSVALAGDVNNDGYDDILVGAMEYDVLRGCAYLFYGGADPDTLYDAIFIGRTDDSRFGNKVSGAGDLNNDGYDDIMVAAYMESDLRGAVYIYYGGNQIDTIPDVVIYGSNPAGFTGYSIAPLGDLNKDGFDDIIVGEKSGHYEVFGFGKAQVFFGGANMDNSADITFFGQCNVDLFGSSVALAGDVNGDGYSDIVVGAIADKYNKPKAYIYYGGKETDNKADLIIDGEECVEGFACSVSSAGDINNDGYDDIVIGSYINSTIYKGKTYIYFGGAKMNNRPDITLVAPFVNSAFGYEVKGNTDLDLDGYSDVIVGCPYYWDEYEFKRFVFVYRGGSVMDNEPDLIFQDEHDYESFGISVSMSGDVNGDSFNDILIGSVFRIGKGSAAFIYLGGIQPDAIADLTFRDQPGGNCSGYAVSPAGDINGDGYDDMFMTAKYFNSKGRVYLYFGGTEVDKNADVIFDAPESQTNFGNSISCAGDLNNDGYDDIIIGSSSASYIFFGGSTVDNQPDVILSGNWSKRVSGAGDFNKDGYDDVIVGMIDTYHASKWYIYFGGSSMDNISDVTLSSGPGANLHGNSVASGDLNSDGFSDLIVAGELVYDYTIDHCVLIFFGGSEPDGVSDLILRDGNPDSEFGYSISIVDFNDDGYDDILAGDPKSKDNKGSAYLYYGSNEMDIIADLNFEGDPAESEFGVSVSSAGDINNDNIEDIIIAACYDQSFKENSYVYLGGLQPDNIPDFEVKTVGQHSGYSVCSPGDMNNDDYSEVAIGAPERLANGAVYLFDFHTPKTSQSLFFDELTPVVYGAGGFSLTAEATSGLPVNYTSSNSSVATVSWNTITLLGAGTALITAHQPGNYTYDSAQQISRVLLVNKANLDVIVKDTSKVEGMVNPVFTIEYNGFLNYDNVSDIDTPPEVATEATNNSPVGTYTLTPFGGNDNNYSFNYINGALTIKELTGLNDCENLNVVHPNPVHDYIEISSELSTNIIIYNSAGEIVMQKDLKQSNIDISRLEKGLYFLKIGNRIFKFIKN